MRSELDLTSETLWQLYQKAPFPKASRCRAVAGHDLLALDYTVIGCISSYRTLGTLDLWRLSLLGLCYRGLGLVVTKLDGEERIYFERLEKLAGAVLEAIRDANNPARRQEG